MVETKMSSMQDALVKLEKKHQTLGQRGYNPNTSLGVTALSKFMDEMKRYLLMSS